MCIPSAMAAWTTLNIEAKCCRNVASLNDDLNLTLSWALASMMTDHAVVARNWLLPGGQIPNDVGSSFSTVLRDDNSRWHHR
jgi:hypothetical protein